MKKLFQRIDVEILNNGLGMHVMLRAYSRSERLIIENA